MYQTLTTLSGWNADIVVTPPTWRVRFVRWLMAVTVLSDRLSSLCTPGGAVDRARSRREVQQAAFDPPLAGDTHPELAELFPEGAWERGRPMVLTTQWGKLLFREYRPSDDGRLELVPCTIVFYAPTRGNTGGGGAPGRGAAGARQGRAQLLGTVEPGACRVHETQGRAARR